MNLFDDPSIAKKLNLSLSLDYFILEYSNEILKSLTNLGLTYKIAFNYGDLKPALKGTKKNKKRCI
jgi:hypothetical protein